MLAKFYDHLATDKFPRAYLSVPYQATYNLKNQTLLCLKCSLYSYIYFYPQHLIKLKISRKNKLQPPPQINTIKKLFRPI